MMMTATTMKTTGRPIERRILSNKRRKRQPEARRISYVMDGQGRRTLLVGLLQKGFV